MAKVKIEPLPNYTPTVEIAESKGIGHPDTLCDTLCEKASQALSKYYLKAFKKVLHFNIDKALIIAGESKPEFLAGSIIKPFKIIIAGRATTKVGNIKMPVDEIIKDAVRKHLKPYNLIYDIKTEISEGSSNLKEIEKTQKANDTSFGVAHYPLTKLETLVLKVSRYLNSERYRRQNKFIGLDTKVMGLREDDKITLTIAIAFISRHIKNLQDYKEKKRKIATELKEEFGVRIKLNTLDSPSSIKTVYVTATGFSCENGDDGQVGRGNRFNGLITPCQPMSIEAIAGKNIYHPGKIYQIMAHIIARDLVKECRLQKVTVKILSEIGKPLTEPQIVSVQVQGVLNFEKITKVVNKNFVHLDKFQKDIIFS